MTGALALVGLVLIAFGWASQQVLGTLTPFALGQWLAGAGMLTAAALTALVRAGRSAQPGLRRPMLRVLARGAGTCAVAAALYGAASQSELRLDWTFEGQFSLAEATTRILGELHEPLTLTLYTLPGDPRIRRTRLVLDEFARHGPVDVRTRNLNQYPEDEDLYGIGSSNSVVASLGANWTLVQRPGEGSLYEAIAGLLPGSERILYTAVGAGEGDLARESGDGFSGLAAALETEGYTLRRLPLAVADAIPEDADGLMVIAPRRPLPDAALAAVERYLDGGGALVAFLEPGRTSGIEAVLARYGLESPDRFVVDPASHPLEGETAGLSPVVSSYAEHPSTHGLGPNRMTFFHRARAFELRKTRPGDRLQGVVLTSGDAWTDPGAGDLGPDVLPEPPADARRGYHALVALAEVERGAGRARIAAFGDSDLASNRYLRALYNLDLVLNSVHWALEREPAIALHAKRGGRQLNQFPLPLESSLRAFYGAGLLVPELLLIVGGLVWLRQRNA
jgi:hypothetical protein